MSEHTRAAGMIARYEIRCQHMDCKQANACGTPNRRECAHEARRAGYRYIRGAWYCPEHANERRPNE